MSSGGKEETSSHRCGVSGYVNSPTLPHPHTHTHTHTHTHRNEVEPKDGLSNNGEKQWKSMDTGGGSDSSQCGGGVRIGTTSRQSVGMDVVIDMKDFIANVLPGVILVVSRQKNGKVELNSTPRNGVSLPRLCRDVSVSNAEAMVQSFGQFVEKKANGHLKRMQL